MLTERFVEGRPRPAGEDRSGAQTTHGGGSTDGFVDRLMPSLAVNQAEAIPTLSEWAQLTLVLLLNVVGICAPKRRPSTC